MVRQGESGTIKNTAEPSKTTRTHSGSVYRGSNPCLPANCDFNQMLEMEVDSGLPQTISSFDPEVFAIRRIQTGAHCFGCTAGGRVQMRGAVVKP